MYMKQKQEKQKMKLSEHFNDYEFECHCGKCALTPPPKKLLRVLEDVRSHFGKPVTIMSGYRCEAHNTAVGGAKRSKHKLGIASDIIVSGVAPHKVHKHLTTKYPNKFGIGRYGYFTHIDVRKNKARW